MGSLYMYAAGESRSRPKLSSGFLFKTCYARSWQMKLVLVLLCIAIGPRNLQSIRMTPSEKSQPACDSSTLRHSSLKHKPRGCCCLSTKSGSRNYTISTRSVSAACPNTSITLPINRSMFRQSTSTLKASLASNSINTDETADR